MSPSLLNSYSDHNMDNRPLKRPRKDSQASQTPQDPSRSSDDYRQQSQPLDHIFIAENLASKKPAGKKAPLSCCECRRLKLKCDRTFPCGSCKKRGVSDICPDGVLVSGKGTRFILANTEQLHSKVHQMSDRIRQLEEALESLYAQSSSERHPLLHPELLTVKSTLGLYGSSQTGGDHVPPSSDSCRDANLEKCRIDMEVDQTADDNKSPARSSAKALSESPELLELEIRRLSRSFPVSDRDSNSSNHNLALREYIRSKLPPQDEAEYLWQQAKENALWQYNPHPNETFFPNLAHHCYSSPVEDLSPRRLALILMILAIGCLVDYKKRAPESPEGEKYHTLARAALSEISVMEDTTVETIEVLFYEIWYLLVFSDKKKAVGYAWGLMGLTAKLAQSIGLHRKGTKAKVIPEEVEKRRSLFWELLYLDARISLSLGRPPSLSAAYMDCKRPSYEPDPGCDIATSPHYYQEWKHSCYAECLAPVLDAISRPSLEYSTVLALDSKIRDFSIPTPLRLDTANNRSIVMQKGSLATALETVLLQLHRAFFTRALSGPETAFNRNHLHAPSVVAVFLSASRMIATIQDLYHREPDVTARILGYWSNAFSAAVALCLLVSRAPFVCLAPAALQELERARALFNTAKEHCPRAMQVIPMLETMVGKANDIFKRWSHGQDVPTVVLRHTDDYSDWNPGSPVLSSEMQTKDPFANAHPSLKQCIAEAHSRASLLFPLRKPCQCAGGSQTECPPSHSWAPPPKVSTGIPVLPEIYLATLSNAVRDGNTNAVPISPTSKFAMDTLNFELGALNPNTDQSWMAWF